MKLYNADTPPNDADEAMPVGDEDIIDVSIAPSRRPPPLPAPRVVARAAA